MASFTSKYIQSGRIRQRSNEPLYEYEKQLNAEYPNRPITPIQTTPPVQTTSLTEGSERYDTGYGKWAENFKNGEILKGLGNLGIDVLGAPADVLYNTALQGQSILSGNGFRSPSQYVGRMTQKEYEDELKRMGVIDQTTYEKIDNPYARDLYLSAMTIGSDPLNALDVGAAQIARNIGREGSSIYARELARGSMPKNTTKTVKSVEGYLDSKGRQKTRTVKKEVLPQAGNSTLTHVGDKAQVNAPYATTLRRANTIVPEATETVSDARNIANGTPIPVNPNKRVSRAFNVLDDSGQTVTKNFDGYEYNVGDRTFLVSGKGKKWNVIDESGNTIGDTYRTRNEASQNLERLAAVDNATRNLYTPNGTGVNGNGVQLSGNQIGNNAEIRRGTEGLSADEGRSADLQSTGGEVQGGQIRNEGNTGRTAEPTREAFLGNYRVGDRPLNEEARTLMNNSGVDDIGMAVSDHATFSRALDSGRANNPHGAWVDPKTPEELAEHNAITLLSDDGLAGIAIEADGNIVGAFKNIASAYRGAIGDMLLTARKLGGTKMDCYGRQLVSKYERAGYVPVARIPFNAEYVDDAALLAEKPDVYVMMKNADSFEDAVRKYANDDVPHLTPEQLDNLPTFEDYDEALAYRDKLLAKQESSIKKAKGGTPKQNGVKSDFKVLENDGKATNKTGSVYTIDLPNNSYTFYIDKRGKKWYITDGNTGLTNATSYARKQDAIDSLQNLAEETDMLRAELPEYDEAIAKFQAVSNGKKIPPKKIPVKKKVDGELRDLGADTNRLANREEYIRRYGEQEAGTGVPNATPYGEVSKHASTIVKGGKYSEGTIDALYDAIETGGLTKTTVNNKTVVQNAEDAVARNVEDAYKDFGAAASGARPTRSSDIALGYELAKHYDEIGDYEKAASVLEDVTLMLSEVGRALQSARLIMANTRVGRERLVKKLATRISKDTGIDVEISPDLLTELRNATTEDEITTALKNIQLDLWRQVPMTFADKFNAWRYTAMLGNPKTILRNEIGNGAMYLVRQAKDALAGGIENALVRTGKMKAVDRTHTFLNPKSDRELIDFGQSIADARMEDLRGVGKWSDIMDMNRPQELPVFGTGNNLASKTLGRGAEKWRTVTNQALNEGFDNKFLNAFVKGDRGWLRKNYGDAMAKVMKARGITVNDVMNNPKLLDQLHEIAKEEALRATFRDASKVADAIGRLSKRLRNADNLAAKSAGYGVEATVPFKRTPINIVRRSLDYSPVGLMNGGQKFVEAVKKGEDINTAIDRLSAGLTGTGIAILGAWLASQGLVRVHLPSGNKAQNLARAQGQQGFSVEIGDKSVSLDWLAPAAIPFFLGASLDEVRREGWETGELVDALVSIGDPFFEMTMLQGVQNLIMGNDSYTDDSAMQTVANKAVGVGGSLVGQTVPTMFGQVARTIDPSGYRTNSTSVQGTIPSAVAYNLNRNVVSKIPFANQLRAENVDVWGRTETKDGASDYVSGGLENFFSPAYINDLNTTPVDEEVTRLYDLTGKSEVLPYKSSTTFKDNGTEYRMTQKERADFQKTRGQYAYNAIDQLIKTQEYANMSDEEKVKAIQNIYDDAFNTAKKEYLVNKGATTAIDYDIGQLADGRQALISDFSQTIPKEQAYELVTSTSGYDTKTGKMLAIFGNGTDATTRDLLRGTDNKEYSLNSDMEYNVALLLSNGLNAEDFEEANDGVKAMFGSGNISAEEAVQYLETTSYSREQKYALLRALTGVKSDKKNPYA